MSPDPGTVQTIAAQVRISAEALAAKINSGEYEALFPEQRCELRLLTFVMSGWADKLDPDRAPAVPELPERIVRIPIGTAP